MSAAILDQRRNPIGISRRSGQPGGYWPQISRLYLDDSYAESFGASYALGPTAYNLASTDDLKEQSHCEGSKGSCTAGHFFRFPNTNWNVLIDVVGSVGLLQTKCNQLAQRFRY